jgi:hypothetical protein
MDIIGILVNLVSLDVLGTMEMSNVYELSGLDIIALYANPA